jgi:hypothetical protein
MEINLNIFATRYDCTVLIVVGQGNKFVFMKILSAQIRMCLLRKWVEIHLDMVKLIV